MTQVDANGEFAGLENRKPMKTMGPTGPLSMANLPSSATPYWLSRQKAEVLAAIDGSLLTLGEACQQYGLRPDTLLAWRKSVDRAGIARLRIGKR